MPERPAEHRTIDPDEGAHDRVPRLATNRATDQQTTEDGHQRDRQDRRPRHREGLRERQGMEQLALLAGQGEHRDESQDDDRHREKDRAAHQAGGIGDRGQHGPAIARVYAALLYEAEGVLGDNDPRVDQHADGDGDAGQRHDVRADPEVAHEQEGGQHRQRQRDRHDQDRPHVEEEQDVHKGDDDRLLDERALERVHRARDECRPVVKRDDPDARRQPGLQRADLLLDPGDDVDGAHPVARHHDAANGFVRALDERRRAVRVANLHRGHLTHVDRDAIRCAHHEVVQVAHALDQAKPPHHRPRPARLDHVAADVPVAPHHRVDDRGEGDVVGAQAIGIEVDLVLTDLAADAGDLSHARHGVELIPNEPVLNGPQVAQRVAFPLDGIPEHMPDPGGIRAECRHHARWHGLRDEVEALQHPGPGEVKVDRVLEDHVDH